MKPTCLLMLSLALAGTQSVTEASMMSKFLPLSLFSNSKGHPAGNNGPISERTNSSEINSDDESGEFRTPFDEDAESDAMAARSVSQKVSGRSRYSPDSVSAIDKDSGRLSPMPKGSFSPVPGTRPIPSTGTASQSQSGKMSTKSLPGFYPSEDTKLHNSKWDNATLPTVLEGKLYPNHGYYARELLHRLFEKQKCSPPWQKEEFFVGFEFLCKAMRNPHNTAESYTTAIDSFTNTDSDFDDFLNELFSVKRKVIGDQADAFSSEHVQHAIQTFVYQIIGKNSNQIDSTSAGDNDSVLTSIMENVAVVTPRDVFFHPGLARIAALLLERYDLSIMWYVFERIVTVHLAGMWGPTVEELELIAPYSILPGAPPRAMVPTTAGGNVFGPFEGIIEERLIDTKAFRKHRKEHGGKGTVLRSWGDLHLDAVGLARDYITSLPLNGKKKNALELLDLDVNVQTINEEIRGFFANTFSVEQQLGILDWLLFDVTRKMGEDRFAPVLIAAYYWTLVQKQQHQKEAAGIGKDDYATFKKALRDIAKWEHARMKAKKPQMWSMTPKASKRTEREDDVVTIRKKVRHDDDAAIISLRDDTKFEDDWDNDVSDDEGYDPEDGDGISTSTGTATRQSGASNRSASTFSGMDSEGVDEPGKGWNRFFDEYEQTRETVIQRISLAQAANVEGKQS